MGDIDAIFLDEVRVREALEMDTSPVVVGDQLVRSDELSVEEI